MNEEEEKERLYSLFKLELENNFSKYINSMKENGLLPNKLTNEIRLNLSILPLFQKYPEFYEQYAKENNSTIICKDKFKEDEERIKLRECYEEIIKTLDFWLDIKEEYKDVIATWIIGTYIHKDFNSYPYLFVNAMRGSGKSRLLNVLKHLCNNGEVISSLTEAVLFRSSNDSTMLIDEFEDVASKEKSSLRLLLNACYKKGNHVRRMKKVKSKEGEKQEIEEFELYRPLVMANINGMDEVLNDRCINIILEKSVDFYKMRYLENFDSLKPISSKIKEFGVDVCRCRVVLENDKEWNNFLNEHRQSRHTIHTIHTRHYPTLPDTIKKEKLFLKILNSNIQGRHLELFFPLFQIAYFLDEEIFLKILNFAEKTVIEKKEDEVAESKDVMLYQFISEECERFKEYNLKYLTEKFKEFINVDNKESEIINTQWVGYALKRLNLITSKKRLKDGRYIMVDVDKAKIKLKIFKKEEITENKPSSLWSEAKIKQLQDEELKKL